MGWRIASPKCGESEIPSARRNIIYSENFFDPSRSRFRKFQFGTNKIGNIADGIESPSVLIPLYSFSTLQPTRIMLITRFLFAAFAAVALLSRSINAEDDGDDEDMIRWVVTFKNSAVFNQIDSLLSAAGIDIPGM